MSVASKRMPILAAVALMIVVIGIAGVAEAQTIKFPRDDAEGSVTVGMQKALFYMGCYKGSYAAVEAAADGDFGRSTGRVSRSYGALNTLSANQNPGLQAMLKAASSGGDTAIRNLVDFLATELKSLLSANKRTGYCGTINVPASLDASEIENAIFPQKVYRGGDQVCEAKNLSKTYLSKFNGELAKSRDLEAPLSLVIEKFGEIFKPDVASDDEVASENMERLSNFGTVGVNRTKTKEALELALKAFRGLVARYGANDEPCGTCFAVNDWKLLRNKAIITGGVLYHSADPAVSVNVANIKRSWMFEARDNMLIFRRINKRWQGMVNGGGGAGDDTMTRADIEAARDEELDLAINRLAQLETIEKYGMTSAEAQRMFDAGVERPVSLPTHIGNGNKLMADLAADSDCEGFDGATVEYGG